MAKYFLMHKDSVCGSLRYDENTGRIAKYKDFGTGLSPFLGSSNLQKIGKWWEMRAIPASRVTVQDILCKAGCVNAGSYLAKNLALSMTDAYWIRPADAELSYQDVKLINLASYYEGKVPYHNATSYDPNASLGGRMEKYWDLSGETPTLVKESYLHYGQQSINEAFATRIHTLQNSDIPFVKYTAVKSEDGRILCRCDAFTSDSIEFIPAYEVVESCKTPNDRALYDSYIDICVKCGIDRSVMQDFMDYQTLTDFVISNTDEHLLNFGILRNSDTMKILGPAPIFDSGNSMFFLNERRTPYTRAEILACKVTSFYHSEEALLKKIHNRHIVKADLLPPSKEVCDLYESAGIPRWKAECISQNYETKIQLLQEFQRGKKISLYAERCSERKQKKPEMKKQKFIMLCGIPGSGKTEKAFEILSKYMQEGYRFVNSTALYPVTNATQEIGFILDRKAILDRVHPVNGCENAVTVVSLNDIRKEIKEQSFPQFSDLTHLIAEARVKTALLSGATVIYDAANLGIEVREHYVNVADDAGVQNKELYVMSAKPRDSVSEISTEDLHMMAGRFAVNRPSYMEGWTSITYEEQTRSHAFSQHEDDHDEH